MAPPDQPKGFTVTDRRSFAAETEDKVEAEAGVEAKTEAKAEAKTGTKAEAKAEAKTGTKAEAKTEARTESVGENRDAQAATAGSGPAPATSLPPVDFHTFILSLGSSALLHLGEIEDPDTGKAEKDLGLARHTIEIIAMIRDKTKGNLSDAEVKLVDSLLYDLRLRFVAASR